MVIVAALILAGVPADLAPPPATARVAAERQATAMVRILPGAQVRFAEIEKTAPDKLTNAQVRGADGSTEFARLVEFQ